MHPSKSILLFVTLVLTTFGSRAEILESDFRSDLHPRIFVTASDRPSILQKTREVAWAEHLIEELHQQIDPIVAIHNTDPSFVISRMQMHWEEGSRYTRFFPEGNFIPRREGNAKYPTVRITYGRAASSSAPVMPLDKLIPYSDGSLLKPAGQPLDIVKISTTSHNDFYRLGLDMKVDTVPFAQTGLGVDATHRAFMHLAWKSAILYYLTQDKQYAKLSADILWTLVRGAAQQEWVNPDEQGGYHGYLSFETLGDTRHFATLPLTYDMIYNYLHDEYFDLEQYSQGIPGQPWAPPHAEGKEWALQQFEIMFKKQIENKLQRGGGLIGNWNINEQQSAMLYALALDADSSYSDGHGRAYYVNQLIFGPTTAFHGAYMDVIQANLSPATGLWPEAPGGYGQGSNCQLIRFGYIYYRNGLDFLTTDPILNKASGAYQQMLFPNGYITNVGDATYSTMVPEGLELMLAYYTEKGESDMQTQYAKLMQYTAGRDFQNEFYYPLFFYVGDIPTVSGTPELARCNYSEDYALILERNNADDARDALAFAVDGFSKRMGHRQPNGLNLELYGRGHILAPDQGIGQDYWSYDTQVYKTNVAGHNTVSPNGKGADHDMPMPLSILHADPWVSEDQHSGFITSPYHQYVDVETHFTTSDVDALQRRTLAIVRTSRSAGYYLDIFRSKTAGDNLYHDYIYHNMGKGFDMLTADGKRPLLLGSIPLDTLSGLGYSFFQTIGSISSDQGFQSVFHLGVDDTHMKMLMAGHDHRTIYQLNSPCNHRYYIQDLKSQPVPAILVRQKGEAWDHPFVAIYEPYGNGAPSLIRDLETETAKQQAGVVKVTVNYLDGHRKDRIIQCDDPTIKAQYQGLQFTGTLCIASYYDDQLCSLYIGNGTKLQVGKLKVSSDQGMPFDAYVTYDGQQWQSHSQQSIVIR